MHTVVLLLALAAPPADCRDCRPSPRGRCGECLCHCVCNHIRYGYWANHGATWLRWPAYDYANEFDYPWYSRPRWARTFSPVLLDEPPFGGDGPRIIERAGPVGTRLSARPATPPAARRIEKQASLRLLK